MTQNLKTIILFYFELYEFSRSPYLKQGSSSKLWDLNLATVITNLLSAIPWIGKDFVEFVWGGFSVNNATLNRFFSLHYLLPFILAVLAILHLMT